MPLVHFYEDTMSNIIITFLAVVFIFSFGYVYVAAIEKR